MIETILTFVVGGFYDLYDRFGRWFLVATGSLALLFVVFVLYLCGAFGSRSNSNPAASKIAAMAAKEAAAKADADRKNAEAAAAKKKAEAAALAKRALQPPPAPRPVQLPGKVAGPPPKPKRPENLADWKKDDYLAARREGDPRLPEAIVHLAARFQGSDAAAQLLVGLLRIPAGGNAGTAARDSTTAIVDALVANGSAAAREIVRGLLGGSIQAADDRGVVTALLRALARRAEPADENLLLAAVVEKSSRDESLLAAAKATAAILSATELQKAAAAVIQATASEDLRLRLAKRIIEPNLPAADRARLIECLKEPRPENLAAQALLFVSAELEPKVSDDFQRYFLQCSGAAFAKLAGIPAEANARSAAGEGPLAVALKGEDRSTWDRAVPLPAFGSSDLVARPLRPDVDPAKVARTLWTQPFCEALDQRLTRIASLGDSRGLVMLAATIPLPAARSALERTLEEFWYETPPPALFGTAWPQGCQPEPGLLLVLKSLPHRNLAVRAPGKTRAKAVKSTKSAKSPPRFEHEKLDRQKQEQIAAAWLQGNESLMQAMMERFRAAAMARKIDHRRFAEEAADAPVTLQEDAEIVAAFALDLPGTVLPTTGLPVAPLRIRYVMADEKAKIPAVAANCKRQLENCAERSRPYGVWIDGYQADPHSARKVSIDVVVRKRVPNAPVTADQAQNLVIEVLSVETVPDLVEPSDTVP